MQATNPSLAGLIQIEPDVFRDARGIFWEAFKATRYADLGIDMAFVQDNFSWSVQHTLRGLHYQLGRPQGKLVSVVKGQVYDVAVDIRKGSPTFAQWYGVVLSDDNMRQLYIPPGFAHGFCVLSEIACVFYKCTDIYSPADERGIIWNDPALKIPWPIHAPLLSPKDQTYKPLAEMDDQLPTMRG